MSVIDEIAAERKRQIEAEGWTSEHDDQEHEGGALAIAAACYAETAGDCGHYAPSRYQSEPVPIDWPWHSKWWKPKNPRRDLIRAGALIVAEIERLDRMPLNEIPAEGMSE